MTYATAATVPAIERTLELKAGRDRVWRAISDLRSSLGGSRSARSGTCVPAAKGPSSGRATATTRSASRPLIHRATWLGAGRTLPTSDWRPTARRPWSNGGSKRAPGAGRRCGCANPASRGQGTVRAMKRVGPRSWASCRPSWTAHRTELIHPERPSRWSYQPRFAWIGAIRGRKESPAGDSATIRRHRGC